MKAKHLFLIFSICIIACTKESYLRMNINLESKAYVPNFNNSKIYFSNTGDTILMSRLSQTTTYEKSYDVGESSSYIGEVDYLELERIRLTIGSENDSHNYNVVLNISTALDGNTETYTADNLVYTYSEKEDSIAQSLTLLYKDTMLCNSSNCLYSDSITLTDKTFFNVYSSSQAGAALYVNKDDGLVGFRTSDNITYELLF